MNRPKSESPSSVEGHLAALYGRINYERQDRVTPRHFKLRNMREILRRLGQPHLKYPVIHVAGTKGKGSVCTMLGQILSASGQRTGVYTSPHLESIHQRMAIDGAYITDQQLVDTLTTLEPVIRSMDQEAERQNLRNLTFFEITTAAALQFFATQKCEAVVLEVGLGGRLDSTNVCQPDACIITTISLDHTRQLGESVDKIAFEKAGIIKPSVPVVSGVVDPVAAQVIAQVAAENGSTLIQLGRDFELIENSENAERQFGCRGVVDSDASNPLQDFDKPSSHGVAPASARPHRFQIGGLKLSMLGHHQRVNATVAVAAVQTLNARGWNISDEHIRQGLGNSALSGRTEVVSTAPAIMIDMAHNVASIEALVDALKIDFEQWQSARRRILIFATSRDKDAAGMLRPLVESFDEVNLTRYQDNPRGVPENELLTIATEVKANLLAAGQPAADLTTAQSPEQAWVNVTRDLRENDLVCITGSAFLVAEIRKTVLAYASTPEH